jgi:hypothetical protein
MSTESRKKQIGRPTLINDDLVQKLEAAVRDGFSIDTACRLSGISRSTYYEHFRQDEDFSDKMKLAQEWTTQRAKQVVAQAIDKGDLKAAQWWLERKARAEFATNMPVLPTPKKELFGNGVNDKFLPLLIKAATALGQQPKNREKFTQYEKWIAHNKAQGALAEA